MDLDYNSSALFEWLSESLTPSLITGPGVEVHADQDDIRVRCLDGAITVEARFGSLKLPLGEVRVLAQLTGARDAGAELGAAPQHRFTALNWVSEAMMRVNAWNQQHQVADQLDLMMESMLGKRPLYGAWRGDVRFRPETDGFTACAGAVTMWLPMEVCRICSCLLQLYPDLRPVSTAATATDDIKKKSGKGKKRKG